jgi:3-hydroxyisobutyrate dehydrogenase-like beta-hydroxyacid dehydrogenase
VEKVGFVGLGLMGGPMAMHLIRAGLDVAVYNRTPGRAQQHVDAGAELCSTPAELAGECGLILVCVSDTPDVEEVIFGSSGLAEAAKEGSLIVDHSTISPSVTREIAEKLRQKGLGFVDAPISGGTSGATEGTLMVMAGGEAEHVERLRSVAEHYSSKVVHIGPAGQGQLMKCCNQLVVGLHVLALGEGIRFAEEAGLKPADAHAVLGGGAAGSFVWEKWGAMLLEGDLSPGFKINLHRKDLLMVRAECERVGLDLPGLKLLLELYEKAIDKGLGELGDQALGKVL